MSLFHSIAAILKDPPPAFAFELSEAGIAMVRPSPRTPPEVHFQPLKPEVISVSPLRDNILMPDELAMAVRSLAPMNGSRKRRDAVVILPDYCARIAVLDFDEFPPDAKEQASLVRFRMRKSVPFDVESAALSYWPQPAGGKKFDVVVAVAPLEIIARYEAPFRAAGLNPGLVTPSSIAMMDLIQDGGITVVAKMAGRVLTLLVLNQGVLKLARCLELADPGMEEITTHLYATLVFVEDNLGGKAERLLLCGFGGRTEAARQQFQQELGVEVDSLRSPLGVPAEHNSGLLGYLRSIAQN